MNDDDDSLILRKANGKPVIGRRTFIALIGLFIFAVLALAVGIAMGVRMSRMRSQLYAQTAHVDDHLTLQSATIDVSCSPLLSLMQLERVKRSVYLLTLSRSTLGSLSEAT